MVGLTLLLGSGARADPIEPVLRRARHEDADAPRHRVDEREDRYEDEGAEHDAAREPRELAGGGDGEGGGHSAFAARTALATSGTIWKMSPTIPYVATLKMGASGSLLNATITFEVPIPARCWIAPEMPHAT